MASRRIGQARETVAGRGLAVWALELGSFLCCTAVGEKVWWELAPVAHFAYGDRQFAVRDTRRLPEQGSKGWLRLSMCQIASASLRAITILATLPPRLRPIRARVRSYNGR